ncbi:ThiF family adenylyltransferase [Vibrio pomeroyi]|uniref:ThiF family adenylyltransferase n=1 Tax=Vibrio pomeroyi TaxID=198832 RepID=UPI0021C2B4C9|nr:ThiF family adenylyltransferase [Vibrio pomeroyi]
MADFFPIEADEIDQKKVELSGSISMIKAVAKGRNTTLIDLRARVSAGKRVEFITVDVCNDDVPSRNSVGICYQERIVYAFDKESELPSTYALRKDFPITMHQNSPSEDAAKSLCLYLDPTDVVAASWTAEKHLKRTNWWLTQASLGKLHPDDQGIEQLFFNPRLTLVLPYDYDRAQNHGRQLNAVAYEKKDKVEGGAFIVTDWEKQSPYRYDVSINVVTITTPSVVHGIVNRNVNTISKLNDLLKPLGVELVQLIREQLLEAINSGAYRLDIDTTAFILTFPMQRSSNGPVEARQTMAIIALESLAELAVKFEVTNEITNLVRTNALGKLLPMNSDEVGLNIEFMECLKKAGAEERRLQSGIIKPFGKGTIIGAGALGGALLDFWVKAGWGSWTVVDEDSFRPHNFTRHVIPPTAIGQNKAEVVADHYSSYFQDCKLTGINIDAKKFETPQVKEYLSQSDIVIDASASLSYPRAISQNGYGPRHISAFFIPSGSGAVLLVEDKKRKVRLSSLEAQYYRVIINKPIGDKYLVSKPDQFRSGVSCRDNSFVMSHSRVMACSSLLSEHIIKASNQDEPIIMIWHDDIETGERSSYRAVARKSITINNHTLNKFKVYWDEGIEERIRELRALSLPNETGGILIGYHDMTHKVVYIVDALPAPDDSIGTPTSFQRGTNGILEKLDEVANRTANNVGYIGEWHSHPRGASARMSTLDIEQLTNLAINLSEDGLPAYQMIVGENETKVYEKVLDSE